MKLIRYILVLITIMVPTIYVMAQPAPPTTPYGNPVPVENLVLLLIVGLAGVSIKKISKKK